MSRNDSLLRAIADLTGTVLERPAATEVTALGAGRWPASATGLWDLAALAGCPFETGDPVRPGAARGRPGARPGRPGRRCWPGRWRQTPDRPSAQRPSAQQHGAQ